MRLYQGDYARETAYSDQPVAIAVEWEAQGAPRLHVVDLDGARAGEPLQAALVSEICQSVSIPVEVSGGLRSAEQIRQAFERGAERVQLGSVAVRDPELVRVACSEFPGRICVGIDSKDGVVRVQGWTESGDMEALDLAERMVDLGVPRIMFTDIARDSTQTGPNFEALEEMVDALRVPVVASGGVSSVEDLVRLAAIGCEGAIVGKALYEGSFQLGDALAAVGR